MAAVLRKRLKKLGKDEKGFTLIELLAVIVIIGIIAVIAIPLVGNILDKSRNDADLATARQIYDAARLYITSEKNGDFAGNTTVAISDLKNAGYLDSNLYLPSSKESIAAGTVTFENNELKEVLLEGENKNKLGEFEATEILSSKYKKDNK